jgi:excinuclease Cho
MATKHGRLWATDTLWATLGVRETTLQTGHGNGIMLLKREDTQFSCNGEVLEAAPRCPGVYRFFSEDEVLLYIGKSIDIGTRLNSHFTDAKDPGRQQRMMTAVHRVDCQLTAGEVGALLIENAAIKAENPLYNRRQRRSRKLWTQRLQEDVEGFLQVVPSDFCPAGERIESVFGLFRSRHHIDSSLRALARDQGLCLRILGAERGRGPCFQHQIGRCRGACTGLEAPAAHNARLLAALERQRIAAWPFPGPVVLLEERGDEQHSAQPRRQFHLLHHWSYLGSFERRDAARRAAANSARLVFDRDTYRIAFRALRDARCPLLAPDVKTELANPFQGTGLQPADDAEGTGSDRAGWRL